MAGGMAGGIWLPIPGYIEDATGVGMGIEGPAGGYCVLINAQITLLINITVGLNHHHEYHVSLHLT